jgi:hypothetical protein
MEKLLKKISLFAVISILTVIIFNKSHYCYADEEVAQEIANLTKEESDLLYFFIRDELGPKDSFINNVEKEEMVLVTASKLYTDYHKNEVKADLLYRNKALMVTGSIKSISRSIGENYYLALATSEEYFPVQAHFDTKYTSVLADLYKGQKVELYCQGNGLLIGAPMLKGCRIFADWVDEKARVLHAKYEPELKEWVRSHIHTPISQVLSNEDPYEQMMWVYSLLLSTPDNSNYISYKDGKAYLTTPLEEIGKECEDAMSAIKKLLSKAGIESKEELSAKLSIEKSEDLTFEAFIQIVKDEREKMLAQKRSHKIKRNTAK